MQTKLRQSITWIQGTALTVGAVLGSGILVLPAIAAQMAGPASLVSWIAMGALCVPMVIAIGAMSSRYPDSGGLAAYARMAFGARVGEVVAWLILSAMPFGMPLTALIGAHYLGNALGWGSEVIHLAAALLILTAILLNYRGIDLSGRAQVLVVGGILCILGFIILSAAPSVRADSFIPLAPYGWFPVGQAMLLLFFAFIGWEMVVHLAEEFRNPRVDLPLSLGISLGIILLIYVSIAWVVVGNDVYHDTSPAGAMLNLVSRGLGSDAALAISCLGFAVCYCPIHSFIAGFSRLVYAQACKGELPACFSKLHPKFQTPHLALLCFVPIFFGILYLSYSFEWNMNTLIHVPSTVFLIVYILGMSAAGCVLPPSPMKVSAWISAILSLALLCFSGIYLLYPIMLILLVWLRHPINSIYHNVRRSNSSKLAGLTQRKPRSLTK